MIASLLNRICRALKREHFMQQLWHDFSEYRRQLA